MIRHFVPALVLSAALAGCETAGPAGESAFLESAPAPCPVVDSKDWHAWVNRMPGPDSKPMLIVEGQVTLPTPGYTVTLTLGRADRSATPVQQLILQAAAPSENTLQALTTQTARIDTPAIAAKYKGVQIKCGDKMLAEISDIPDAM